MRRRFLALPEHSQHKVTLNYPLWLSPRLQPRHQINLLWPRWYSFYLALFRTDREKFQLFQKCGRAWVDFRSGLYREFKVLGL